MNEERKHVEAFIFYMFNAWSKQEAVKIFGEQLGAHLYGKWEYGDGNEARFYAYLDGENRDKIIARALDWKFDEDERIRQIHRYCNDEDNGVNWAE